MVFHGRRKHLLVAGTLLMGSALAQQSPLVLADFEGAAAQSPLPASSGFITWQDGSGTVNLTTSTEDVAAQGAANHVLVTPVNIKQWGGFTHDFSVGINGASGSLDLSPYSGIRFWFRGSGSGNPIQFELLDNRGRDQTADSAERFFFRFTDDSAEWKQVSIPFSALQRRSDFQPAGAPSDGLTLKEVWGYALNLPQGETTYAFDRFEAHLEAPPQAEAAPAQLSFKDKEVRVTEGQTATFEILLNAPQQEPIEVEYETTDGSATTKDFVYANGILTFQPGETRKVVEVSTYPNSKYSGTRTVNLELYPPKNATLAATTSKLIIGDDDSPSLALGDDFESSSGNLNLGKNLTVSTIDVKQGSAQAHPEQDLVEGMWWLKLSGNAAPSATRNLRPVQDWTGAQTLSFWYYGENTGKDIQVQLEDATTLQPSKDWKVTWSEEFNNPAGWQPSEDTWNFAVIGTGNGNSELQYYTDRVETVSTDGQGNLRIRGDKAPPGIKCWYGECLYTSARISTQNKKEFEYGRVEARLKIPAGQGFWPAFWMLGSNIGTAGWPGGGEIDILETIGKEPYNVHGTLHGPGYYFREGTQFSKTLTLTEPVAKDFHTYAIEKRPGEITFFFDGKEYYKVTSKDIPDGTTWVFDQPFFILLNLAIGGAWPGSPDETTPFPADLLIDYVRYYEPSVPQHQISTTFKEDFTGWKKIELPISSFKGDAGFQWNGLQRFRLVFPDGLEGNRYVDSLKIGK
ncbi:carbohydrate binding domain-containing protein [Deinococcus cellulosilyticus]|uniref:GH16 domain-containing protein n=1 Tax=Deinococcus cellulosilyticus (strain DSM 18568 / NBRC 106333 / KACC 11606 / 5516J-15) TaxID=1223518 RepID=A0A511N984_DEIC1|nr:carbohydrate binding domain-containing protein [Deinococcus cellulosilyticus]GEM49056.1 hypothetical protein DC3_46910 [Deinococcus cellulosilyticus NBRC 106333 = KACC 11606]